MSISVTFRTGGARSDKSEVFFVVVVCNIQAQTIKKFRCLMGKKKPPNKQKKNIN